MRDIKRMDLAEFVSEGYLQELNRQFLHPLGLALEVHTDMGGHPVRFGGVWDYRDDPEGVLYHDELLAVDKVSRIAQLERARKSDRLERLGYWIQPVKDER